MPVPLDLAWNVPAQCPTHESVLDEVSRLVASSPEAAVGARASAYVERDAAGRWRATLTVDTAGAHSVRVFEAASCEGLASATAVILAVAVEETAKRPLEALHPPAVATRGTRPVRHLLQGSSLVVAVALDTDRASFSTLAPGPELGVGWAGRGSWWRLRTLAVVNYFPPVNIDIANPTSEGGRFWSVTGSARGCGTVIVGELEMGPCVGAEVDAMVAQGHGPLGFAPATQVGAWVSVVGAALLAWTLSPRLAVFLRADAIVPIVPPEFVINPDHILVHQASPGPRGAAGLEVHFF